MADLNDPTEFGGRSNAAQRFDTPRSPPMGGSRRVMFSLAVEGAPPADVKAALAFIPAGARLTDFLVMFTDMDTHETPTMEWDIGDSSDLDGFIDGCTFGTTGGIVCQSGGARAAGTTAAGAATQTLGAIAVPTDMYAEPSVFQAVCTVEAATFAAGTISGWIDLEG